MSHRKMIEKIVDKRSAGISVVIGLLVLIIDYVSGKYIHFPILYVLPIGIAAWNHHRTTAYALAAFLPIGRIVLEAESESLSINAINAMIRIIALSLYAYLIYRTSVQTKELRREIRILEGILPVCASCKRIRNENGEYEQMEKYISEHSEVLFSHGLCLECAKKLYPDLVLEKDSQSGEAK